VLLVARQVEFAHVRHQQFRLGAGIADRQRLQAGLALAAVASRKYRRLSSTASAV
jgi:hypothetical protein